MRVLYVNKLYPPDVGGGAEVTLSSIVAGVRARGVEVRVVTTTADDVRTLHNVDGIVVEGNRLGGAGLLGLSFLNRTEMKREGDTMSITRRF